MLSSVARANYVYKISKFLLKSGILLLDKKLQFLFSRKISIF